MKIISLKIENIASLKGQHYIEFEKIFNHSKVFAITGETGSGKSTILNCISLALYGQHYKKSNKQLDFITLGESYGLIELIYQSNNSLHKAYWYYRLKKADGSYLKKPLPDRSFFKWENNNWQATEKNPEDILGLSFDQFVKTIILNQGEFSKFLTSNFKDRKEILAKLYNGQKLEHLSLNTRRKINLLKQKINQYNAQIQGINENTNFDLNEAKKILTKDQAEYNSLQKTVMFLSQTKSSLTDLSNIFETWEKNKNQLNVSQNSLKLLTVELHDLKKINNSKKETLAKAKDEYNQKHPLLVECMTKFDNISLAEKRLNHLIKNLDHSHQQLEKDKNFLQETHSEISKDTNEYSKLKESSFYIPIDESGLSIFIEKCTHVQDAFNELNISQGKKQILADNIDQIQKLGEKKSQEIEHNKKQYSSRDLDQLIKNHTLCEQEKHELNKALIALENYIKSYHLVTSEKEINKNLIAKTQKQIDKLSVETKEITQNLIEIEFALKSFEMQEMINTIAIESEKTGKCLVCQSDKLENIQTRSQDDHEFKIIKARQEEKTKQNKENELKAQSMQASLNHYISQEKSLNEKLLAVEADLLKDHNCINKDLLQDQAPIQVENIGKLLKKKEKEKKELEIQIQVYQNSLDKIALEENNLKQLRLDFSNKSKELQILENQIKKSEERIQKFKNYTQSFCSQELTLENMSQYISVAQAHINLQDRLKSLSMHREKTEKRIVDHEKTISLYIEEQAAIVKSIDSLKAFIKVNSPTTNPHDELERLKYNVDSLQLEFEKHTIRLNEINVSIAEYSSKLKNFQLQSEQTEQIFNTLSVELNYKTQQFIEQFQELVINDDNFKHACLNFLKKLVNKFDIEVVTQEILTETVDFSDKIEKDSEQYLLTLNEKIVRTKTLIDQKQNAQSKIKEINQLIFSLKAQQSDLENLYDLVGKDEFRNYVLSLIEKNLINQTNYELKHLCDDRYLIKHFSKNTKESPDFYVIDKYRAGLTRKVSTLSGGETFMVSLAMAIALAELTRGTSEVDSFFIDEGFGTLDDESLEEVLEMIHTMEKRGKSIGIISHVKKLTDRIDVNLQLRKSSMGNSNIYVSLN